MTLFPSLILEKSVQENDKTRLDARKSFAQGEVITLTEISYDGGTNYVDVTADMYLDWQFTASGAVNIIVRLNGVDELTKGLLIKTELEDNLFSDDTMLVDHEDDILSYTRDGRNSFIDKHRLAQALILNDLDRTQIWKNDGTRFVAADIVDVQEFTEWSKFITLRLIFESLSNSLEDIFSEKAKKYRSMEVESKKRAVLKLDFDGDAVIDDNDRVNLFSGDLTRG
jgi:hypothetical protein